MATVAQIRQKVEQLMRQFEQLQQEVDSLRTENQALHEQLTHKNEEIEEFKNKLNTLQIAKGIDHEERTALKQKINDYIREIDRCLALLND